MNNKKLLVGMSPLSLLVLSACGGGGTSNFSYTLNGNMHKGPLSDALVFLDYDGDGVLDIGEPSVRTNGSGEFSLTATQESYSIVGITDGRTTDTSSGSVFSGVTFKAPSGSSMLTPTTTLMVDGNLTAAQVVKVVGLSADINPLTFNAYASGVDATDALAFEKVNQQIMNTINAFAAAAEGSGVSQVDAYKVALNSFVKVVKVKAGVDATLDLTSTSDLELIKAQVITDVANASGINTTAFNALAGATTTAIENVNAKIATVTDLTSDTTKNIFSITQVLNDQVKAAAVAEVSSPGSGTIAFTSSQEVDNASTNATPTDITLTSTSIGENAESLVIGTLNTTDSDQSTGVAFTYALGEVSGSDYASFSINQATGELSFKAQPDYETKSSYSVTILSTDEGGKTFSKTFTVTVTDQNEAPTLTVPTGGAVTEDASTSTITGTLSGSDPESDDLSYSVVGSTASSGSYTVTGTYGSLVLNASTGAYTYTLNNAAAAVQALGASSSETESFSVQVTDGTNTPAAQNLSFTISGANDAPTISVSGLTSIAENSTNAFAATVTGTDPEDGSKTVSLSGSGRDDAKFEIVSNQLRIKTTADFETQNTYQVQLSVTDAAGVTTLKNLELNVTDVAEAVSGSIVDGYVAGATVFQDLNNNNILDSGEPFTVTSATGSFILSGVVSSATAPLKMISGFDIGTNQAIVTSLGVPSVLSGNAVASPIATITSINQAKDAEINIATIVDRAATYFNISEASQAEANILRDDPINNLTSSDSDVVSAAKDVFEANQFIMGLTHISEKIGSYLVGQIDTSIQNAGENSYGTYAGSSLVSYEKLGADAFLNTSAEHITSSVVPTSANAFQISSTQVQWQDYDATLGLDVTNRVMSTTSGSTVSLGSDAVKLNVQNLINAANSSGTYKSPTLSFELLKIPTGSGSGTINFTLIDGSDGIRSGTERQISLDVNVNWTGDGSTAQIEVPAQTLSGSYISNGLTVNFTISNLDSDVITMTQAGANYPTTLDVKLSAVIDALEGVGSISLLTEGTFNLAVTTDLPLKDVNDTSITKIQTNLQLVSETPLEVFIEDVTYFEDDPTPIVTVYLNRSHTEDVTITYNVLASGTDSATAGSDFTAQASQTVTILAGLTSASIALPILADSSVENAETFSVTASSTTAGSLAKATATVTIEDSDTNIATSGELDALASDVIALIGSDISAALLKAYESAASAADALSLIHI